MSTLHSNYKLVLPNNMKYTDLYYIIYGHSHPLFSLQYGRRHRQQGDKKRSDRVTSIHTGVWYRIKKRSDKIQMSGRNHASALIYYCISLFVCLCTIFDFAGTHCKMNSKWPLNGTPIWEKAHHFEV